MATKKYYVVWQGHKPGIYHDWLECKKQIEGFSAARYKSYPTLQEAEAALRSGPPPITPRSNTNVSTAKHTSVLLRDSSGIATIRQGTVNPPILDSLAVDAACSGNPGKMEYQGVYVASGTQVFHYEYPLGTNNIGEFLAIVHGLAYMKKHNLQQVMYSDSVNAMKWVKIKECKSKLPVNAQTQALWNVIHRAEQWLHNNTYTTQILKWDTDQWGEIPADFGRK